LFQQRKEVLHHTGGGNPPKQPGPGITTSPARVKKKSANKHFGREGGTVSVSMTGKKRERIKKQRAPGSGTTSREEFGKKKEMR